MRRRDDRTVPSARRSSGVLPQLLFGAGSGNGLTSFTAVAWEGDAVVYLDQRHLPHSVRYERARTVDEFESAIKTLAVRGAPCIGVFGAFGAALLMRTIADEAALAAALLRLRNARPTAVNLAWAVDRVNAASDPLEEAHAIAREQVAIDAAIAENGLELIPKGARILTHCNTGPIATAGGGTAVGVIIAAQRAGKKPTVFVDETRPLLQGSRLNYLELTQAGVDAVLQADSAAAIAMARKNIDLVVVGADRIVRNGDTANKIGTYGLAILAAHHGIPFYVAAPRSTFDPKIESGEAIPIEERSPDEITSFGGARVAPEGAAVYNPAFDVTPGRLITAFVTEHGILRAPYGESIPGLELRPFVSIR
ncbi:MAG TPA: S-methyl-5-thioribose-1-phosphate isomerase [Candidatus Baltobacteraceae bacterium]|nr:S-methyl-5-thioribose-1-phosphate isomerase [Candidatus Baltobacteraceae bacterium]